MPPVDAALDLPKVVREPLPNRVRAVEAPPWRVDSTESPAARAVPEEAAPPASASTAPADPSSPDPCAPKKTPEEAPAPTAKV